MRSYTGGIWHRVGLRTQTLLRLRPRPPRSPGRGTPSTLRSVSISPFLLRRLHGSLQMQPGLPRPALRVVHHPSAINLFFWSLLPHVSWTSWVLSISLLLLLSICPSGKPSQHVPLGQKSFNSRRLFSNSTLIRKSSRPG